jgi:hypothetical protein
MISYNDNSVMRGDCLRSNDSGWPMPPLAPKTATLASRYKRKTIKILKSSEKEKYRKMRTEC